jgi:hypothetical protein
VHADASAEAIAPEDTATAPTDTQIAVIAAVARTIASVPVMLPHRPGKDIHPLDRVTDVNIRTLAGHLTPAQARLTYQGADLLFASGFGSATPAAIASAIATRTDWDHDPAVNAALLLATATATPLGFCDVFPPAWRALLRHRSWPMISIARTGETA